MYNYANLWRSNIIFSTQVSDVEKLKEIAARAGFVQTRGPQKGKGSIRQMLEALIDGKAIIVRIPSEQTGNTTR